MAITQCRPLCIIHIHFHYFLLLSVESGDNRRGVRRWRQYCKWICHIKYTVKSMQNLLKNGGSGKSEKQQKAIHVICSAMSSLLPFQTTITASKKHKTANKNMRKGRGEREKIVEKMLEHKFTLLTVTWLLFIQWHPRESFSHISRQSVPR